MASNEVFLLIKNEYVIINIDVYVRRVDWFFLDTNIAKSTKTKLI